MSYRYRITFDKNEEMKYTGHLDLYTSWIRIFRRAHIALEHSKGFHPQPRIQLAAALPLGFTSNCEVMDVWLIDSMDPDAFQNKLKPALPPGIIVQSITPVDHPEKPLQVQLSSTEYKVTFLDPVDLADIRNSIRLLLESTSLPRERRGKTYDLRPLIEVLELSEDPTHPDLLMRLEAKEGLTGRPEEVLLQMGMDPYSVSVRRTQLIFNRATNPIPA